MTQAPLRFDGPAYEPKFDRARLSDQHTTIRDLMLDGRWRSLAEIESRTGYPAASISAQLRHLRKERFGSYRLERRRRGERKSGLFEYRVLPPKLSGVDLEAEIARIRAHQAAMEARLNSLLAKRLALIGGRQ